MLEKPSEKVGERTMREEIALLAGPRSFGETRERWLERAAAKLQHVPYRMLRAIFYGEIDGENHWAIIELRAAALVEAKREADALATQLETLISQLNVTDEAFHQPTVDALGGAVRALRGMDRA